MRSLLAPILLLLQSLALSCAAEQKVVGADHARNADTDVNNGDVVHNQHPTQHQHHQDGWTPYQNGWENFNDAMAELRKIKSAHRKSKKPTGLFSILFQYALMALPTFRIAPPSSEPLIPSGLSGHLLDAVKLLQKSADQNNTDAIYVLAQMNFFGNFSYPRNFHVAFDQYKRLADHSGNSSAQHMVGLMYATGVGGAVERDQAKALLYHKFAADSGHTRSEMTVASRYYSGTGVPKNCDTSCHYYKKVADKAMAWIRSGPPGGMTLSHEAFRLSDDLGGVYGEGASAASSGINALRASPNSDARAAIDDAIEYWDLMSQKGDFKASYHLGLVYYEGQRGLDRDVDLARRYFLTITTKYWRTKDGRTVDQPKAGLEKYASRAAGYIGRMWLRGEGVKQDFKVAQRWFERGIKHGDAQSQWGMGIMKLHGHGMSKNIASASQYFKAAADQDFNAAHVALGSLHLSQGQPEDLKIASQYFEAAARWGNIEAQYYLAEMMHHGVGRDKTCNVAMQYYKVVAEKAEAIVSSWKEANQAYDDGDHELAFLEYLMAAEQGYEKGQNNVAFMLDPTQSQFRLPSWLQSSSTKPGLLQNSALALIYWTRSSIQNNIDSLVKMGDYYLQGVGTDVALEKAAQCYVGASEHLQSAQALYNLGWMHENGVGLTQDFHLAKRYYDLALETNEEAYLPVTLSLFKLRARSAWNTFTNGRVNSIQDEPSTRKDWSLSEWIANFLQEDAVYYDDYDYMDDEGNTIVGSDGEPMEGAGSSDYYLADDGVLESLIILGLAAALVFLMYYRAQRQQQAQQQAHQQQQVYAEPGDNNGQGFGGQMPPHPDAQEEEQRGLFPQPGDPDFAQWAAGGVGH